MAVRQQGSFVSDWAHCWSYAKLMHNNKGGPSLCRYGKEAGRACLACVANSNSQAGAARRLQPGREARGLSFHDTTHAGVGKRTRFNRVGTPPVRAMGGLGACGCVRRPTRRC